MVLFTKHHLTFMSSETISENKLESIATIKANNDVDLVRSYLRDIGRVPLLSHEQEITLGRQVQEYINGNPSKETYHYPTGKVEWVKEFIDGKFHKSYNFPQTTKNLLSFTINPGSRKMREYEITLPSFSNPKLKSLTLEDGSRLEKVDRSNKKVYVAIGDSITHGVGQDSATHLTYTYLLANKLDMKYYNFAVGGGKISIPVGRQLKDIKKIDLITILIGYNDWVFDGKTPTTYTAKYRKLIEAIRVNHPETEIHCITLLYTRNTKSRKTGTTYQPADYRNALISLVKELQTEGDKHIHLIKGDSITSEKNLRGPAMPKDMVHLGIKGAAMFAEELAKIIQPQLEKKQ